MSRKLKDLPQLTPWEYNPTTLQGLELRDLKALYTANRDIMVKRLKRLKQSEFTNVEALKKYSDGVPTIKSLTAIAEGDKEFLKNILARELADLKMQVENRYTLVGELKEIRNKSIATLHQHGYDFIDKQNYEDFVDFQNYLKQTHLDRIYDSDGTPQDEAIEDPNISKESRNRLKNMFDLFIKRGGSLPVEYHMIK